MNFIKVMAPGVIWAILILILSSISAGSLRLPSFWDLFSLDKASHAAFYAILVFLLCGGFQKQTEIKFALLHAAGTAIVFGIIYGGLIELYQAYVLTDRKGDWFDFIANVIGCYVGMVIFLKWKLRNPVISN
jgi:VanZ family protein